MTKEEKPLKDKLSYDYNILSYAQIADDYLKRGDEQGMLMAKKTLDTILDDRKVDKADPDRVVVTDPEVLDKTIKSYLQTYDQCKGDETIASLIKYNSKTLDKYVEGGAQRALEELKSFTNMKYKDIQKKIAKARYTIAGKEVGASSDEDVEKAQKTIEKYQKVLATISSPDTLKISEFRNRVEEGLVKDSFKVLYPKIEKKEKETKE